MQNQVGQVLKDRYELVAELGRGGMAEVYLARDRLLMSKQVVVKFLLEKVASKPWVKQKFKQEVEALSRIDHPAVVTVLDAGETETGRPFYVMQYIEGESLRSRLRASGVMQLNSVVQVVEQIAQGLAAVHERGVFHRDLKPENLMLQRLSGGLEQVKIIDFGIASIENSLVLDPILKDEIVGTRAYLCPERLMSKPYSAAGDIFSLAVIVYEMLTGRLPFEAKSVFHLLYLQGEGLKVLPSRLRKSLSSQVDTVILKALAFNPKQRYQSALDFSEDLKSALSGIISVAATMTPTEPVLVQSGEMSEEPELPSLPDGQIEVPTGAVPLESRFYIERTTDSELRLAISRRDSIVLVKGSKQMGKTSLLARGLHQARRSGYKIILTDFQKLSSEQVDSLENFFLTLAEEIAEQLQLGVSVTDVWNPRRGASVNFERFLRKQVLDQLQTHLVWGMDEVDRLFGQKHSSEVFGLFRSWHNERSLDPEGPWCKLTLVIAYAAEAHLFITDPNQSPFNVGTRLVLEDFNLGQVLDLNSRYGSPLSSDEVSELMQMVCGHPYLLRLSFYQMVAKGLSLIELKAQATAEDGVFGGHLRRILSHLNQDESLKASLRAMLRGESCSTLEHFYILRSLGVIRGESSREAVIRCKLYEDYLRKHL
ncbi:MAG: serine/threonine-protein kinase [Acidobacteriota bacterium]|nr:AAA-like domain-containing protein [Blastocatellia bacterium]MDW8411578.1 serine/threonine-protein kinase [Acidobacteriota bacterium]